MKTKNIRKIEFEFRSDKKRTFIGHVDDLMSSEKVRLFLPVK